MPLTQLNYFKAKRLLSVVEGIDLPSKDNRVSYWQRHKITFTYMAKKSCHLDQENLNCCTYFKPIIVALSAWSPVSDSHFYQAISHSHPLQVLPPSHYSDLAHSGIELAQNSFCLQYNAKIMSILNGLKRVRYSNRPFLVSHHRPHQFLRCLTKF